MIEETENNMTQVSPEKSAAEKEDISEVLLADERFNILRILKLRGSYRSTDSHYTPHYKCCGVKTIECLSPYISIKAFLVCLSIFVFFQSALINGTVNFSITPIEMRYRLTTFESGLIASFYDLGNIIFVYPVTYFGGSGRKPTWLGYGILIFAFGCFVYCIPQLISGKYIYSKLDNLCSSSTASNALLCNFDNDFLILKRYKWFFYGAMFIMGTGGTTFYTLGYNYVDENTDKYISTVYIAILNAVGIIGPAVGFLFGSAVSTVYVDFEKGIRPKDISSKDILWVGAYWIPFLVTLMLSVLIGIPMMWFPSFVSEKFRKKYCNNISKSDSLNDTERSFLTKLLESRAFQHTKEIVTNVHFTLLGFATGLEMFVLSSLSTLGTKYLVSRFDVKTSNAGIYIGLGVIPSSVVALGIAAYVIKNYKIRSTGLTRLVLVFSIIPIPFFLLSLLECKNIQTLGFGENDLGICSSSCGCSRDVSQFSPICGNDGRTYFSPCFAGCHVKYELLNQPITFTNCSCISGSMEGKSGTCDSQCSLWKIVAFVLSMSLLMFCMYFCMVPVISLTLTSLRPQLRPLALGIQWCYIRLLGSLPGPPMTGLLFDNACLHYYNNCGKNGNCAVFDSDILSYSFIGALLILKSVTAVFYAILWWTWNVQYEENDDYGEKSAEIA